MRKMSMKKKLVSFVLLMVMLLSFTGCSKYSSDSATAEGGSIHYSSNQSSNSYSDMDSGYDMITEAVAETIQQASALCTHSL